MDNADISVTGGAGVWGHAGPPRGYGGRSPPYRGVPGRLAPGCKYSVTNGIIYCPYSPVAFFLGGRREARISLC
jgi:hypothetical protein